MVEIEYKDVKIYVPQGWDDITLADWDKLHKLKPQNHRERVAYVAQICKLDAADLLSWPTDIFNLLVAHTRFVFENNPYTPTPEITIEGVRYIIAIEDDLTLGEWIDADEVQRAGEDVLANVLAIVCRPAGEDYDYKNNEKRRDMFAALPVSAVLPLLGFFLQCKQQLDKHTRTFSQLVALVDLLPPSTAILQRLTVGTKLWRIWPIIKYLISTKLLQWRLRKLFRLYGISETKKPRKTRKGV